MREFALVVGLLCAVYGLADLIQRFAFRLLFSKTNKQWVIVPLVADAEYTVRQIHTTRQLYRYDSREIIVLDCGLSSSEKTTACRLCDELDMWFCTPENLQEIFRERLQPIKKMVQ